MTLLHGSDFDVNHLVLDKSQTNAICCSPTSVERRSNNIKYEGIKLVIPDQLGGMLTVAPGVDKFSGNVYVVAMSRHLGSPKFDHETELLFNKYNVSAEFAPKRFDLLPGGTIDTGFEPGSTLILTPPGDKYKKVRIIILFTQRYPGGFSNDPAMDGGAGQRLVWFAEAMSSLAWRTDLDKPWVLPGAFAARLARGHREAYVRIMAFIAHVFGILLITADGEHDTNRQCSRFTGQPVLSKDQIPFKWITTANQRSITHVQRHTVHCSSYGTASNGSPYVCVHGYRH